MSRRATIWLAWSACAFSLTLTALTVLLIVSLIRSDTPIYYYWLETSMVAVGYGVVLGKESLELLPDGLDDVWL
jgi:hypothetical protein